MSLATAERPRLSRRLVTAMPGWRVLMLGTPLWAVVLASSAALWLAIAGRWPTTHWQPIVAVFALGGILAFPTGLFAAKFIDTRSATGRFAAAFIGLGLASALGVAFVFSMQYRVYYARWHDDFLSIGWIFQLLFTGAGAVYQFAVLGSRMFFPLGLAALFAASLWHARQTR